MNPRRTSEQIIHDTEQAWKTAKFGLDDFLKQVPPRSISGLMNIAVFGRAVTNVLQNLRSTEPTFDEWYPKYRKEMESDELMKYFYNWRTDILKKGQTMTMTHVHIKEFNLPSDMSKFGPPPPHAKNFFIGDQYGGTGWEVVLSNGTVEKYYVELPSDIGEITHYFQDAVPRYHLGKELQDTSIENLSRLYLDYLLMLIDRTKKQFLKKNDIR